MIPRSDPTSKSIASLQRFTNFRNLPRRGLHLFPSSVAWFSMNHWPWKRPTTISRRRIRHSYQQQNEWCYTLTTLRYMETCGRDAASLCWDVQESIIVIVAFVDQHVSSGPAHWDVMLLDVMVSNQNSPSRTKTSPHSILWRCMSRITPNMTIRTFHPFTSQHLISCLRTRHHFCYQNQWQHVPVLCPVDAMTSSGDEWCGEGTFNCQQICHPRENGKGATKIVATELDNIFPVRSTETATTTGLLSHWYIY